MRKFLFLLFLFASCVPEKQSESSEKLIQDWLNNNLNDPSSIQDLVLSNPIRKTLSFEEYLDKDSTSFKKEMNDWNLQHFKDSIGYELFLKYRPNDKNKKEYFESMFNGYKLAQISYQKEREKIYPKPITVYRISTEFRAKNTFAAIVKQKYFFDLDTSLSKILFVKPNVY